MLSTHTGAPNEGDPWGVHGTYHFRLIFPLTGPDIQKKKRTRIRQRKRKKGNLAYNRVQRSSLTLLHHNCFSKPIWIFLPSIPFLCPPIPVRLSRQICLIVFLLRPSRHFLRLRRRPCPVRSVVVGDGTITRPTTRGEIA